MTTDNPFGGLNFDPKNLQNSKDKEAKMRDQVAQIQKMLASIEAEGMAGIENYRVKILLNGRHEAIKVMIDPELLKQSPQILCDLVASAITDASRKLEIAIQNKMMGFIHPSG